MARLGERKPALPQAAESRILDHALAGTLDEKTLEKLLPAAAAAAQANDYRRNLAGSWEHVLLGEWHRQLEAGAADLVLDSMRSTFERHAEAIEAARNLIDPAADAEQILASAAPEMVQAWQGLSGHIAAVSKIAAVAREFGPRLGSFPRITEYPLAEGFRVSDTALFCAGGPDLALDSAPFLVPDGAHRASAFFKVPLKLHSIASARARYAAFAADQFDRVNSGPVESYLINGKLHPIPKPENPYRAKASVR